LNFIGFVTNGTGNNNLSEWSVDILKIFTLWGGFLPLALPPYNANRIKNLKNSFSNSSSPRCQVSAKSVVRSLHFKNHPHQPKPFRNEQIDLQMSKNLLLNQFSVRFVSRILVILCFQVLYPLPYSGHRLQEFYIFIVPLWQIFFQISPKSFKNFVLQRVNLYIRIHTYIHIPCTEGLETRTFLRFPISLTIFKKI